MKIIKRILSIETAVEIILVIFAVANFSIISDYFLHSGLNKITSYSVGALLGGILITVALMLSKVEKDHKDFKVFVVGLPLIMGIKFLQKKDILIKISGFLLIGCSIYFALNLISVN